VREKGSSRVEEREEKRKASRPRFKESSLIREGAIIIVRKKDLNFNTNNNQPEETASADQSSHFLKLG
jgi:hypothetical protein